MIQIQAWQVDIHLGKLDLRLLVRTEKLKGILKLHCCFEVKVTSPEPVLLAPFEAVA